MNIVVGSGPSGIAVADALLASGQRVLMLDAGLTLEPDRQAKKRWLATHDPETWTPNSLAFLKGPPIPKGQVPVKHSFGSDFPYATPSSATPVRSLDAGLSPSFAMGGLSTVWGSAMLPFRDADTPTWPITSNDLREGYTAAARLMPLSAVTDDMAELFPLHRPPEACLAPTRQAQRLMSKLADNRSRLKSEGISFGRARLAVDPSDCVRCGLCLEGCPHDLIYSAKSTLEKQRQRGLAYEPGTIVRSLREDDDGVTVQAIRSDGSPCSFKGARVFLGAGVVNTTEIMLRSINRRDRPVHIKDAQYFLIPAWQWRGTPNVERERLNTLCQTFIELDDPTISRFLIHIQAYTYNGILRDLLIAKAGRFHKALPMSAILGRLLVLQSYLHSDHSGTIEARLEGSGDSDHLSLIGRRHPATSGIVKATVKKLSRVALMTGLNPIGTMTEIAQPGRGFHCGGSFPMARNPHDGETDTLGRPAGFSRVHLVDSSTFPSIPATTITFAVMANAHRIGTAVARANLS